MSFRKLTLAILVVGLVFAFVGSTVAEKPQGFTEKPLVTNTAPVPSRARIPSQLEGSDMLAKANPPVALDPDA
ncbi:MAG: hypothetical protein KAT79_02140, partial [candidate division Zixibacteria bacterium]|nr:hypothetical protein [candidate division Zixibacteria bacterium]